jgi:hypothetical protein
MLVVNARIIKYEYEVLGLMHRKIQEACKFSLFLLHISYFLHQLYYYRSLFNLHSLLNRIKYRNYIGRKLQHQNARKKNCYKYSAAKNDPAKSLKAVEK